MSSFSFGDHYIFIMEQKSPLRGRVYFAGVFFALGLAGARGFFTAGAFATGIGATGGTASTFTGSATGAGDATSTGLVIVSKKCVPSAFSLLK